MSFEGVTKDIKDERQLTGKGKKSGLKWVGEIWEIEKPRWSRTCSIYTTYTKS